MSTESPLHDRLHDIAEGMSYRELGELTGTNAETVRRYMQGQSPSVEFLTALCRRKGINAQWLLTGSGPMRSADIKVASLREANFGELLSAMAISLELLRERLDRVERFVHTLETRLRAQNLPAQPPVVIPAEIRSSRAEAGRVSSQERSHEGQSHSGSDGPAVGNGNTEAQPGARAVRPRATRIADAVAQRPRQGPG
ncbi:MAG: helix-turn-helix transcriptional regulator [Phycisphaerales bacterium]|nr:helix-turn-helix transcriptional regulator [Phycisphaerales bacterium]